MFNSYEQFFFKFFGTSWEHNHLAQAKAMAETGAVPGLVSELMSVVRSHKLKGPRLGWQPTRGPHLKFSFRAKNFLRKTYVGFCSIFLEPCERWSGTSGHYWGVDGVLDISHQSGCFWSFKFPKFPSGEKVFHLVAQQDSGLAGARFPWGLSLPASPWQPMKAWNEMPASQEWGFRSPNSQWAGIWLKPSTNHWQIGWVQRLVRDMCILYIYLQRLLTSKPVDSLSLGMVWSGCYCAN